MSGKMPFFKFDADAWLTGKVQLLSNEEKGAFVTLLARIWRENGKIKNDKFLPIILRVDKATLDNLLANCFELEIIYEIDGFLRVKFIDEQLNQRFLYIEKQREFGAAGGRPKKGMKPKQKEESRKKIEEKKLEKKETNKKYIGEYPETIESVIELSRDPRCAAPMDHENAEKYFLCRAATDWVDANGRLISPGNIFYDIRKWMLNNKPKYVSANCASDDERNF